MSGLSGHFSIQNQSNMKRKLLIISLVVLSAGLFGQGVYNNGGKIIIGTGVTMYVAGPAGNYRNETNTTDGTIDLSGSLKMTGNLINNVAASDIFSTVGTSSEVVLSGTAPQTVGGLSTSTSVFNNLTINNATGVILAKNARVNGIMTFTNGLVNIGNNNFTFGASSSTAGTPSVASMIIASGTGQVMKEFSALGSFNFPVGDNTGTPKYSPVTLNFTAGTFAPGAFAGLNVINAKYNDPSITGSYLNRYWNVTQTGITGFTCNALFSYNTVDVAGTESSIYALRVLPTPFSSFDPANIALHQLTANGLTSFGTFTGGPGFKTLNLKLYLEGFYIGGGLMNQAQGVAGNQFPGNSADRFTLELHDPITYLTTVYSAPNNDLNKDGTAAVNVPVNYSGSYYVTIKQRNSIATVSAAPLSFAAQIINYDFTTAATQAFGGNLKNLALGVFGIYSGDVNQDGIIDLSDLIPVGNQAALAGSGYIPEDINGDGLVDLTDILFIGNNAAQAVGSVTP